MPSKIYALILAGGSGERFWPLSRKTRPKQLLALVSQQTLLQETLGRLEGFVPRENILILTNRDQEPTVRKLVPELPKENIVAEPAKRDTAAAIALGAGWISKRDRTATMIVLPADHVIHDKAGFQKTLRVASKAAEETGELVTIGIKPTWACPGFGYVEMGEEIKIPGAEGGAAVSEVKRFREKPNSELAETFVKKGNFRWNAGMFIWSIPSILSALHRHTPQLAEFVELIHQAPELAKLLEEKFAKLPKISIDYAIMEKASRVLVVEAAFDWDDVGGWTAVAKYLKKDAAGNFTSVTTSTLDAQDNIICAQPKTHVALLGVRNLIVVQTEDAVLVCHRHEAERIKELVAKIPPDLQ
jgi:mannose-1-phosphate guanylyltransferase